MTLNWQTIARAEASPTRLAILEFMHHADTPNGDPGWSTKTLAAALDAEVVILAHHVRHLASGGLLERVGSRQVRGAVQTFYRLGAIALEGP